MATASQLSTDPALETHFFWEQYKAIIITVVALITLGGLGYLGYELYVARQAANAEAALAGAQTPEQYQQVIARYPGSAPAASACLLLAAQQRAKRNYAEANTTLHKFIDQFPKHEMITTAWMGVAANLESLGKNDEALSTYQRLATEYPQSYNTPLALLAEVPLLKAKNKNEEARRVCETVISQYHDNVVASEAFRALMSLPQPAPAVPPKAVKEQPIPMARPPEEPLKPASTP